MAFFDRYLRIRIVSAEPERLLTQLLNANVELLDIASIDFLTVEIRIKKMHGAVVRNLVECSGGTFRITGRDGIIWSIQSLLKRPVFLVGILVFAVTACMLNDRVFFVEVSGNEHLPDRVILSAAEECGIRFGTKASKVHSEDVKNLLLKQLPQLQWLGITTSGSVAKIQVKERSVKAGVRPPQHAVSSIVASRDGVLSNMTVYKGNPLFQAGQSVQAGDTLVSGFTDCGIVQLGERADAEIFAYTFRNAEVVTPRSILKREEQVGEHTCVKVRIGKKVINFCNHSGISDATCVKMYLEDYVTLPGGFRLPVSIIKIRTYTFCVSKAECDPEVMKTWLPEFACSYITDQMIAGKILDEKWQWSIDDRLGILKGNFACHEMIGQVKFEEIIEQNAEDS